MDIDRTQERRPFLRRELVRDRPPGRVRGGAELPLEIRLIDLDHGPVDLPVDRMPVLLPVGEELLDPLHRLPPFRGGRDGQPALRGPIEEGEMRLERDPFGCAERVHPHPQGPRGGHLRVLLTKRSGCCVARVGEHALLRLPEPVVQLFERLDRQEDLPAHLDHGRWVVTIELPGDAVDRSDVRRDVLADPSVATRGCLDEDPALVGQRAGDAVDLQLTRETRCWPDGTLHPRTPRVQLLERERVVEREHRRAVLDGREERRRSAADRLRRRIRGL